MASRPRRHNARRGAAVAHTRRLVTSERLEGRALLSTATPAGGEFPVNVTTALDQTDASSAIGAGGDFVIAWQSGVAGDRDVYARRYAASGEALGGEFRLNQHATSDQIRPALVADPRGGFIAAWQSLNQDSDGWDIYCRRFDDAGTPLAPEFRLNALVDGQQITPTLAVGPDGGFVAAWTDNVHDGDGNATGVYVRRFGPTGAPLDAAEFPSTEILSDFQNSPAIAIDPTGQRFGVAWSNVSAEGARVLVRWFGADGVPLGGDVEVTAAPSPGDSVSPEPVIAAAAGGFVVAWQAPGSGGGTAVYARRFDASGAPAGEQMTVATQAPTEPLLPSVAADPAGGFVVAWHADGADGSGPDIYARRYDDAGAPQGPSFLVNTTVEGRQATPSLASQAGGHFVVAWVGQDDNGAGVVARRYAVGSDLNEAPTTTGFAPVSADEDGPDVVVDLFGAFADSDDADAALVYTVTANTNPTLFSSSIIDGTAGTLTMRPAPDASGAADVSVRATDTGGLWAETTFTVTVAAVNDAPVNHVPGAQENVAGRPLVFSAANNNAISVADADAGTGPLRVTLAATGGTLTLGTTAGLDFTAGDGAADASMTFAGTTAAVNAALEGMRFDAEAGFSGAASVSLTTDDQGHTGSGGPRTDSDTVAIAVTQPPPPSIAVAGATVTESDGAAAVDAVFTVTLSEARPYEVTVQYTTQNGAAGIAGVATAPADYAAALGTLTFKPGETSKTIPIQVAGDALDEVDEGFSVVLSNPTNGTLKTSTAAGRIVDNDPVPFMTVGDAVVTEGAAGSQTTAIFTVTLSAPSGQVVRTNYRAGVIGDTATRFADYDALAGQLEFQPGETEKTVTATVFGDGLDENDERFGLLFGHTLPINFTFTDGEALATILDDDPSPTVSIGDETVTEGDAPEGQVVTLTVTLSAASGRPVTLNYFTRDDTAAAPGDYESAGGALTFAAGETSKTIQVRVRGDAADESDTEAFNVFLGDLQNATFADSRAQVFIQDDDPTPTLSVDDVSVVEGDDGTTAAVFAVRLSAASGLPVTVRYATADGTASAAGAAPDYDAATGTLSFAPGETIRTVTVLVRGDASVESDETFTLTLTDPSAATVADGVAVGTVTNDDSAAEVPPHVMEVFVSGTAWSAAFRERLASLGLGSARFGFAVPAGAGQLVTLPWENVNQVSVRFDADVVVVQDDLSVRGVNVPGPYAFGAFAYDSETKTATWTLAQPLRADKVLLDLDGDAAGGVAGAPGGSSGGVGPALDGEWASGADNFPSGDGAAGGDFEFRLNVLPGDVDRSGRVDGLDTRLVLARQSTSVTIAGVTPNTYSVFYDVNGDGRVNALDLAAVRRNLFRAPPAGEPSGNDPVAATSATLDLLFSSAPVLA